MATFRIFIADDHEVVRKGLMSLLQAQPDWEVCGEAADGREAVDKAQQLKPDVVILDIGMPSLNGLEATRQILKSNPQAKVLILTLHDSDQVVREVLNAGARGFLLKSDAATLRLWAGDMPALFLLRARREKRSRAYAAPSRLGTLPQVLRQTCYCIVVNA